MKLIEAKIDAFIRAGEGDFNRLACELFHRQCQLNAVYGHFAATACDHHEKITQWEEIPALPIVAFKKAVISTFPVSEAAVIFHSSGTTSSDRSSHYFKDTRLYDLSVLKGWPSQPSGHVRIIALSPEPASAPDSSLVHMFRTLIGHFGDTQSGFIQDQEQLAALLGSLQKKGGPVWLLGTTLALNRFLDFCDARQAAFSFESHLLVMDTGGFKGRTESVPAQIFYQRLCATLGISMFAALSEYGMCELSSPFYTRPGAEIRTFHAPPWVRWRVVHPLTGQTLPGGEQGVLEIFDLANVHSVLAIRTEDTARATDDGFLLDGRIPAAPAKGCSLTL